MTGFPVAPGELVDTTWLNATGLRLLWDSTDAAITFPVATITTPTLSQAYSHLLIMWRARSNIAGLNTPVYMQPNSDATAGAYNFEHLRVNGAAAPTSNESLNSALGLYLGEMSGATAEAGGTGLGMYVLGGYAGAFRHISLGLSGTVVQAASATSGFLEARLHSGRHAQGTAATSLKFISSAGSFNSSADTRFSVYGMAG